VLPLKIISELRIAIFFILTSAGSSAVSGSPNHNNPL